MVEVDNPGEALGSGKSEKSEGSSGTDGQAGLGGSCNPGILWVVPWESCF